MFIESKIGIDIGKDSIKLVESVFSIHGYIIKEAKRYKIPYDESGNSTDENILSILEKIIPIYRDKEIHVAISHDFLLTRTIDLKEVKNPNKKIEQEIAEHFHLPKDQLITSNCIRHKYNSNRKNALCLGINKAFYTKNQKIINYLDNKITSLTAIPVADTQSFLYFTKSNKEHYKKAAIINIGAANATISIIHNEELVYYRILVDKGSFRLSKQLSNSPHVSFKEAELLKRSDISDEKTQSIINQYAIELANEINHTIEAWGAQHNMEPEKLFLVGGGSILKNLKNILNQRLTIPVTALKLPRKKFKKVDQVSELSATFFTAIGLSIKKPIVSLPLSLQPKKSITGAIKRSLMYTAVCLILVCGLLQLNTSLTLKNLKDRNNLLNKRMEDILQNTFQPKKIVEPYLQMKQRFNLYYKSHQPLAILKLLKEISTSIPEGGTLYLNNLDIKGTRINITGTSTSYTAIDTFKQNIKNSILFEDITFRTNREHKEQITFYMQMTAQM